MELDQSIIDVTVVMDENYNLHVAEGVWASPLNDCMSVKNKDSWSLATHEEVCKMDGLTFHETSWHPATFEIMEVKKGDWDEYQNTRG